LHQQLFVHQYFEHFEHCVAAKMIRSAYFFTISQCATVPLSFIQADCRRRFVCSFCVARANFFVSGSCRGGRKTEEAESERQFIRVSKELIHASTTHFSSTLSISDNLFIGAAIARQHHRCRRRINEQQFAT
jgi:hypothetical protein